VAFVDDNSFGFGQFIETQSDFVCRCELASESDVGRMVSGFGLEERAIEIG
jgi:hypothetical protein